MTEVGENTKKLYWNFIKRKKRWRIDTRAIMGDNCPDVSKLEKEIFDMESFFVDVLDIDLAKIKA